MIRYATIFAASLAATLSLSACMHEPNAPGASSAAGNSGSIAAAVADSNRPDSDKLRDANRKPGANVGISRCEARRASCRIIAWRRIFHAHIQ